MKNVIIGIITFYQRAISPLLPHSCRFTPTCSFFFKEAVARHGFLRGSILGLRRILRCHPLYQCGYDPVSAVGARLPDGQESAFGGK